MQQIVISFNYQNENAGKKLVLVLVLVKLKQHCLKCCLIVFGLHGVWSGAGTYMLILLALGWEGVECKHNLHCG